ncbi:leucine-rich repeat extensin-like protein 2 [Papaver somniferum]|uniref:leucine-rich repeat extensin-like protein 2 n=1 Tax=Papaver somniferum TaxID=3469 RepID=UPI000E6F4A2F|nr:leucine-rich repeat extensin-like protein 2 [Papaver somniferum]
MITMMPSRVFLFAILALSAYSQIASSQCMTGEVYAQYKSPSDMEDCGWCTNQCESICSKIGRSAVRDVCEIKSTGLFIKRPYVDCKCCCEAPPETDAIKSAASLSLPSALPQDKTLSLLYTSVIEDICKAEGNLYEEISFYVGSPRCSQCAGSCEETCENKNLVNTNLYCATKPPGSSALITCECCCSPPPPSPPPPPPSPPPPSPSPPPPSPPPPPPSPPPPSPSPPPPYPSPPPPPPPSPSPPPPSPPPPTPSPPPPSQSPPPPPPSLSPPPPSPSSPPPSSLPPPSSSPPPPSPLPPPPSPSPPPPSPPPPPTFCDMSKRMFRIRKFIGKESMFTNRY